MRIRQSLAAAFALLALAAPAIAGQGRPQGATWARALYADEIAKLQSGGPLQEAEIRKDFAPDLASALLTHPPIARSVFFVADALPAGAVELQDQRSVVGLSGPIVFVNYKLAGENSGAILHLLPQGEDWAIADIVYTDGSTLSEKLAKAATK